VTAIAATTAISAAMFAPTAIAGGSGDFYQHLSCSVDSSGANLDITNYDIATGQRYHMDMDSVSGYRADALYVDGVKQPGWNDVYKDFANRGSYHNIRAVWFKGILGTYISCNRTL
jgi:hypothetical protein